jgi:hypothetical protein
MMTMHLVSSEVTKSRIAKWLMNATPVDKSPTWTERRMAIEFGGHTYLVVNGQVFQCAHCGHYDPEWSATEVLRFFEETFGIKPHEIEITCTFSVAKSE